MKVWLRRTHLVLALVSGLFIVNLSISGSLLIFAKEIQAFINPNFWLVTPDEAQQQPLALSKLIQHIALVSDAPIKVIEQAEDRQRIWLVSLANNDYLNINPYSGEIVLKHQFYDTFYGFVMSWHRWLLYQTTTKERPFKILISIASLILIIEMMIGGYLWLKPKKALKRLKIKWRSKTKILLYQLHTTLGVFAFIPLILIAFTGMTFHWQSATKQIVEWLSFSKVESHNFQHESLDKQQDYSLDKAYQSAQLALPEGKVYRVYLPQSTEQPLALRIKMPNESHANSWSWADPNSGNALGSFDASKTSIATKVWNFKYKFHIGDFIAWPVKVLWLFLSLLPCFFVISGVYLWLKRQQN